MIEDNSNEEIDNVPEIPELLQDREPTVDQHEEPELSWDDEPDSIRSID